MNIKLFAPGSKESRCPALPKSQGYSPNKQSCPSPEETLSHTHTHSHSHLQYLRRKQEGEVPHSPAASEEPLDPAKRAIQPFSY